MKHIYYIKDSEQHGPISIDDFISLNLPIDTIVWYEGLAEWTVFQNVRKDLLPDIPPPIIKDDIKVKQPSKLKFIHYLTIGLIASSLISYASIVFYYEVKKDRLKKELITEIDGVFNNRKMILDGIHTRVHGELSSTKFTGKKKLDESSDSSLIESFINPNYQKERIIEEYGLYGLYEVQSGGFEVAIAERLDRESFSIEIISSNNMGYLKPRYEYSYGFKMDGWIPDVQKCYDSALDYFKEDDQYANGFSPGLYNTIVALDRLQNQYYYIENDVPKSNTHLWKSGMRSWKGTGDEGISNDYWIVFYKRHGNNYSISERSEYINHEIAITSVYFLIGLIILFGSGVAFNKLFK